MTAKFRYTRAVNVGTIGHIDHGKTKLIEALTGGEMCVCDLAAVAGVSQSAVSHHLRVMRALRLVRFRKESRMAYYRLDDDHIGSVFATGLEHVGE